jgi:hypothetical protein
MNNHPTKNRHTEDAPSIITEKRTTKQIIVLSILAKEGMDVCSIMVDEILRRGPKRRGSKRIYHTKKLLFAKKVRKYKQ